MQQNNKKSKNNVNIFNYVPKKYSSYVFDKTTKYQKQYGFKMGTGEHATWNNEADAFKHTFMQAQLALWTGKHIAKILGDYHEYQGNTSMGQSQGENNINNWNNAQGREIAREIISQYGPLATIPSQKINDIIAEKVMSRMRAGRLILTPDDNRKYEKNKQLKPKGQSTGFWVNIDYNQQMEQSEFSSYTNPISGNNRIFTRQDIDAMSGDEFAQNEKEIMAQMNSIGIPTDGDMQRESLTGGGVVYVHPYTRSDGTQVRGYYRSCPAF